MSCCGASDDEKEALRISRMIERQIKLNRKTAQKEHKLLLLGAGESGKSTFVKQLKIIHGSGYDDTERKSFVSCVNNNILHCCRTVAVIMYNKKKSLKMKMKKKKQLSDSLSESAADSMNSSSSMNDDDDDQTTAPLMKHIRVMLDVNENEFEKLPLLKNIIEQLRKEDLFQESMKTGGQMNLPDSAEYYFAPENLNRIISDNYVPTEDDIVRSRAATTGILEFVFDVKKIIFRIIDVGGQRSERRKWIHCFEEVTSIVFLASLSEYDQVLVENPNINRTRESVSLFSTILSYPIFQNIPIILFLNKSDQLEKKVMVSDIAKFLNEYDGPPKDYEAAKAFFRKLYNSCNCQSKRSVYSHFTCATDTNNIKFVFEAVKDMLLQDHLRDYSLV